MAFVNGRFIDWLRSLTAKTTTIDGTEQVHIDSSGLSQKALLSDAIRYGGGSSTRITTIGNANIHQKSDGTMWLEVTGQTAGNARGAGAFDWQAARSSATQVASGVNAIAMGYRNVSSNEGTIALGWGCFATSYKSVALGDNAESRGTATVAAGSYVRADGSYSQVFGFQSYATNIGQLGFGYSAVNQGIAQGNLQTFYTVTTSATSTPLSITGTATDRMVIPATRSVTFRGIVQAMCNVSSSSNFIKAWVIEGVITRDGNNTTRIVGTPTITVIAADTDGTPTPSTWAIASITADDTNEALAINVTGQDGTTIRWQATLMYSQVGF